MTFQIVIFGPFVSEQNFNYSPVAHGVFMILEVYPAWRDGNMGL